MSLPPRISRRQAPTAFFLRGVAATVCFLVRPAPFGALVSSRCAPFCLLLTVLVSRFSSHVGWKPAFKAAAPSGTASAFFDADNELAAEMHKAESAAANARALAAVAEAKLADIKYKTVVRQDQRAREAAFAAASAAEEGDDDSNGLLQGRIS